MQDRPNALEIIDAVVERLSSTIVPALEGRVKFEARVAVRALQLARRDLASAAGLDGQERDRLAGLLGEEAAAADLEAANRRLCEVIDSDGPPLDDAALLDHLHATTLAKLAVDQPDYPPLVLARKEAAA